MVKSNPIPAQVCFWSANLWEATFLCHSTVFWILGYSSNINQLFVGTILSFSLKLQTMWEACLKKRKKLGIGLQLTERGVDFNIDCTVVKKGCSVKIWWKKTVSRRQDTSLMQVLSRCYKMRRKMYWNHIGFFLLDKICYCPPWDFGKFCQWWQTWERWQI